MPGTVKKGKFPPIKTGDRALAHVIRPLWVPVSPSPLAMSYSFPVDSNKKPWGGVDPGGGLLSRVGVPGKHRALCLSPK